MADPVAEWTGAIGIASSDGFALAEAYGRHRTEAQSIANAAHIVRCVNAFPALVDALSFALERFNGRVHSENCMAALSKMREALAAANQEKV